eukprot:3619454-Lingulodinium_polyedra.AAC.1
MAWSWSLVFGTSLSVARVLRCLWSAVRCPRPAARGLRPAACGPCSMFRSLQFAAPGPSPAARGPPPS